MSDLLPNWADTTVRIVGLVGGVLGLLVLVKCGSVYGFINARKDAIIANRLPQGRVWPE